MITHSGYTDGHSTWWLESGDHVKLEGQAMVARVIPPRLPRALLSDPEMITACRRHDFSIVFSLLIRHAGIHRAMIARACDLTPSRVGDVIDKGHRLEKFEIIERIADGLHIPGEMLGLVTRAWESDQEPRAQGFVRRTAANSTHDSLADPEIFADHIRTTMPQHYRTMNLLGARHALDGVTRDVLLLDRLQAQTEGATRETTLHLAARAAEFLGWLHQDLGDFPKACYWSDRAMDWAAEADDDVMTAYVLFRKSNQATARREPQKAVALARGAQRLPGITPGIRALAAQQEAQGHTLMGNPGFARAKFDEAYELAAAPPETCDDDALDTAYCTTNYIEMQRANAWIEMGDPHRAVALFEAELQILPKIYRNDYGVYRSRLARAYATAGEPDQAVAAATCALDIIRDTKSARALAELTAAAAAMSIWSDVRAVSDFQDRLKLARGDLSPLAS